MTRIYGIANCATVKKARQWLAENHVAAEFVDFKKQAPDAALLQGWLKQIPLNVLINRKGTTWRKLSADEQTAAQDADNAVALMMQYPSVIKRPILVHDDQVSAGFDETVYSALFQK
ncbi:arsenate reductase [Stenoxybacter acetivorans]|uniref:arsenate reductase n=1 Tax=Stenoxybacter acetivorans TaxID=422441 RepID=UPI00055A0031|nr:arsenate reductase [Stenoxybacter acetivorans]